MGQTQRYVAIIISAVTDAEAFVIEVADANAVTIRVEGSGTDVELIEKIDITDGLVGRQRPSCLGDVWNDHRLGGELLLPRPGSSERVLDWLLAERNPAQCLDLVGVGELFARFVVPAAVVSLRPLMVKEVGMNGSDIEHGHRGRWTGHEYHAVVADGFEGRLIRDFLAQLDELVLGVSDASGRGNLVGGDKICAEDLPGERVVWQPGRESGEPGHDIGLEITTALDETLQSIFVRVEVLEGAIYGVLDEPVKLLHLVERDPFGHRHFSCPNRRVGD